MSRVWLSCWLVTLMLPCALVAAEKGEAEDATAALAWLQEQLGEQFFYRERSVRFKKATVDAEAMARVVQLPEVANLAFLGCRIEPEAFAALGELRSLKYLSLTKSRLQGVDLAVLGQLPSLQGLYAQGVTFAGNSLGGLLPSKELRRLTLQATDVNDADLEAIGRLPALEALNLRDTKVTDEGAVFLAQATSLESLNLAETKVGDPTLRALAGLQSLKSLYMRATQVTSAGVVAMPEFPKLDTFSASALDAAALERLVAHEPLTHLRLFGTEIGEAEAKTLSKRQGLRVDLYKGDATPEALAVLENGGVRVVALPRGKRERVAPQQRVRKQKWVQAETIDSVAMTVEELGPILLQGTAAGVDWQVYDGGKVLLGKGKAMRLHDLPGAFWLEDVDVTGVAAVGDQVWFGTTRGMLTYDPSSQSWSRMAINARLVDVEVVKLGVTAEQVVVTYDDGLEARFEVAEARWLMAVPEAESVAARSGTAAVAEVEDAKANAVAIGKRTWLLLLPLVVVLVVVIGVGGLAARSR